jgi:hypothetical protein
MLQAESVLQAPSPIKFASAMTRWKASAIHLSISAAIGLSVLAAMLLVWYPSPYFQAVGGLKLAAILISVDVVLGPFITLIIFNREKKSLKFDLSFIALLQLAALIYGVHVVYQARPVYVVFSIDRFDVVTANQIDPLEQQKAVRPEFKSLPITGLQMVVVEKPRDPQERNRLLEAMLAGYDLPQFPQHYVPYEERKDAVLAKAKPIAELARIKPEANESARQVQDRFAARNLVYLPLHTKAEIFTALLDESTAEILDVLPVDPW